MRRQPAGTRRISASTCARCGRSLTADATMTPIGPVGPDCATKLAGLEMFLVSFGLDELLNGPLVVPAKRTVNEAGFECWYKPEKLVRLERLAARVGLDLHQTVEGDGTAGAPIIYAELRGARSAKRRRVFERAFVDRRVAA